ncbi:MAG: pyrroloquinoline quinone biosynthesis protein PqqE [Pseudomonadota bacterium]|nr:pyrroloquinoline quinone biosynthesis protein PqqE [Pseudomonadota bacterium]
METAGSNTAEAARAAIRPPLWLLAELTYKCPLHCVYCSNPLDYMAAGRELSTADWVRVLQEGRAMGSAQLGFSGGEPLMRDDLVELVAEGRRLGYYSNLITSGIGLTEAKIKGLKDAGLDHIQVSFQDSTRELNDFLGSTRTFELKQKVARLCKAYDYPMVLNVVLHRLNIDHIEKILEMAEDLGVEYLELANSQFYGWAYLNRDHLIPTRAQLTAAEAAVKRFRDRIGDRMRVYFVVPDYHASRPKACMNGWGAVFITITPDGTVLPCHEAKMLPGISFPNVRELGLREIWHDSDAFNRYRGDGWMKDPCRSCADKDKDFGGCRCQSYLLAGDATEADPVCELSPHHHLVEAAVANAELAEPHKTRPLVFRLDQNSKEFCKLPR